MHEKKIMLFVWYFPSFVLFLFYLFLCFSDFVIFLSTAPFSFAFLFSCLLILTFMFLQFNCFLLMPVVDKLPALLREDLESAFEDDLDSVFDITNLRHSLGVRKRDTEIELKRVLFLCCFSTLFCFLLFPLITISISAISLLFCRTCWWVCRYRGLRRNSDRYMSSFVCIRLCLSCHQFLYHIRVSF